MRPIKIYTFLFVIMCFVGSGFAQLTGAPDLPAVHYVSVPPISPDAALTFYGASASPTAPSEIDDELDLLASNLDGDADHILAYVRENIDTEPQFGLQKGAYGAHLDKSGTAFDQAHLAVTLLRSAGYDARYVLGKIELTGTEFHAWLGAEDARGACEILGAGGIPALINGSTTTDCSSYDGTTLSSVQMLHLWLEVDLGGTWYAFDPSFKAYDWMSPHTLIGSLPTAAAVRSASGGTDTTYQGVSAISGFTPSDLKTALDSATTDLVDDLELEQNAGLGVVEIAGGRQLIVDRFLDPSQAIRQTSLPYQHSIIARWDGDIPGAYRTKLRLQASMGGDSVFVEFDVADIAGRRLELRPKLLNSAEIQYTAPVQDQEIEIHVYLNEVSVGYLSHEAESPAVLGDTFLLYLEADHPYAPAALPGQTANGSYADRTHQFVLSRRARTIILQSWGLRGQDTLQRTRSSIYGAGSDFLIDVTDRLATNPSCSDPQCLPGPGLANGLQPAAADAGTKHSIAEGFAAHWGTANLLFTGLTESNSVTHHLLGVVSNIAFPAFDGTLRTNDVFFDARGVISVSSRSDDTDLDQDGLEAASAVIFNALEQTVLQSVTRDPEIATMTSMFDWFASTTPSEARADIVFLKVDNTNWTSAWTVLDGNPNGNGYPGSSTTGRLFGYVDQGQTLLVPLSGYLGPRDSRVRYGEQWKSGGSAAPDHEGAQLWKTRGLAFLAFDQSGSEHVFGGVSVSGCLNWSFITPCFATQVYSKGGTGPNFDSELFGLNAEREALDKRRETLEFGLDVDYRNGGLTFSPPADIRTGAGGYPYSLELQRTYNSLSTPLTGPLEGGWTHNLDIRLNISTDLDGFFGRSSAREAAATIVAVQSIAKLFETTTDAKDLLTATLIGQWMAEASFDNEVVINQGPSSTRFYRLPNDEYRSDSIGAATLEQTGVREVDYHHTEYSERYYLYSWDEQFRSIDKAFQYDDISFLYTDAAETEYDFSWSINNHYGKVYRNVHGASSSPIPFMQRSVSEFRLDEVRSLAGVTVDFDYEAFSGGSALLKVENSLGRYLSFSNSREMKQIPSSVAVDGDPQFYYFGGDWGRQSFLLSVSDDTSREATYSGATVTNLGGDVETYSAAQSFLLPYGEIGFGCDAASVLDPAIDWKMHPFGEALCQSPIGEIYRPDRPSAPYFTVHYDDLMRADEITDADGNTTAFRLAGGRQAAIQDPAGEVSRQYFDARGRLTETVDPSGRIMSYIHDGAGRVIEERLQLLADLPNCWQSRTTRAFDRFGNTIVEVQHPRCDQSGTPLTDPPQIVQRRYADMDWPFLVTKEIDADGWATVYEYDDYGALIRTIGPFLDQSSGSVAGLPAHLDAAVPSYNDMDDPGCHDADIPCVEYIYDYSTNVDAPAVSTTSFGFLIEERHKISDTTAGLTVTGEVWQRTTHTFGGSAEKYLPTASFLHPQGAHPDAS